MRAMPWHNFQFHIKYGNKSAVASNAQRISPIYLASCTDSENFGEANRRTRFTFIFAFSVPCMCSGVYMWWQLLLHRKFKYTNITSNWFTKNQPPIGYTHSHTHVYKTIICVRVRVCVCVRSVKLSYNQWIACEMMLEWHLCKISEKWCVHQCKANMNYLVCLFVLIESTKQHSERSFTVFRHNLFDAHPFDMCEKSNVIAIGTHIHRFPRY